MWQGGEQQPNPYQQQPGYQQGYIPAQHYATPHPTPPQQAPGAPGRKNLGWLWGGLAGAVAASVVWAGLVFAGPLGGEGKDASAEPDLRGYTYQKDPCAKTDFSAFRSEYNDLGDSQDQSSTHRAVDAMWCWNSPQGSEGTAEASVAMEMWLYKKTDPAENFRGTYESYEQRSDGDVSYRVEQVDGLGDDAYLVKPKDSGDSGAVYLAVRQGWMTYQMSWTPLTSGEASDTPDATTVERMLREATETTLKNMKG
ncbi:hypothetical protein G5C51_27730 [Streptomyces sp. A7024]|uniref:DUF3558 domain-containing protein n=1 Tax=Streptomyces coryli TaxID=1128680 RepID=A0A6G4U613_9ACTN|nr:hypothetical protein [Streptomyces coryli]NGN67679.1 hypothetical protein [Streptomyces coryli]